MEGCEWLSIHLYGVNEWLLVTFSMHAGAWGRARRSRPARPAGPAGAARGPGGGGPGRPGRQDRGRLRGRPRTHPPSRQQTISEPSVKEKRENVFPLWFQILNSSRKSNFVPTGETVAGTNTHTTNTHTHTHTHTHTRTHTQGCRPSCLSSSQSAALQGLSLCLSAGLASQTRFPHLKTLTNAPRPILSHTTVRTQVRIPDFHSSILLG